MDRYSHHFIMLGMGPYFVCMHQVCAALCCVLVWPSKSAQKAYSAFNKKTTPSPQLVRTSISWNDKEWSNSMSFQCNYAWATLPPSLTPHKQENIDVCLVLWNSPEFGMVKKPTFLPKIYIFLIMQWFNKAAEDCSYYVKLLTSWAFCWILEKVSGLHLTLYNCCTTGDSIGSTKVSPHIHFTYPLIYFAYELGCHPLHFCDIRL